MGGTKGKCRRENWEEACCGGGGGEQGPCSVWCVGDIVVGGSRDCVVCRRYCCWGEQGPCSV